MITTPKIDPASISVSAKDKSVIPGQTCQIMYKNTTDSKYDALIKRIRDAVKNDEIDEPFTGKDVSNWMTKYNIMNDDDIPYANDYPTTLLSTSYIKAKKTKFKTPL